jgi:hypothetical protein
MQQSLFEDPAVRRERIVQEIVKRFPTYGENSDPNHRNPVAASLAKQPATFAFGVKVRDVVDAVLELAERQP